MAELFLQIINMSISASWLVLAVVILRLLLKKAPRWIHVLLWALVAVRLICPFIPESPLSLIPSGETVSPEIMMDRTPTINSGVSVLNNFVNPIITESFAPEGLVSANPLQIWIPVAAAVWIFGMVLMLIYTAVSYWRLRSRVRTAVLLRDNIYQSEYVASPFVLGMRKPIIYLPFSMSEQDMHHVIAHEQAHIRRKDHWWKPLGFLLLTLHWFNPIIWIAYILLCRDIELACDEKVIRELGTEQRADYSQALLSCSANRRMIAACPLAFGEVGVKERVRSVLNYKKPTFWIVLAAILACIAVAVCLLTNPVTKTSPYAMMRELDAGDVDWAQATLWQEETEHVMLTDKQIQELVGILNRLEEYQFEETNGSEHSVSIMLNCGDREILLQYTGKSVRFTFDSTTATEVDNAAWGVTNDALNAFFENFSQTAPTIDDTFTDFTGVVSARYTYTGADRLGYPSVTLYENNKFQLTFSPLSSYIAFGSYTISGDELMLQDNGTDRSYYFTIAEDSLIFDAERSSPIVYYPELKYGTAVPDGAVFQ